VPPLHTSDGYEATCRYGLVQAQMCTMLTLRGGGISTVRTWDFYNPLRVTILLSGGSADEHASCVQGIVIQVTLQKRVVCILMFVIVRRRQEGYKHASRQSSILVKTACGICCHHAPMLVRPSNIAWPSIPCIPALMGLTAPVA